MAPSFISVSLLFIGLHAADGFLEFMTDECVFNSTELKDIEYIRSYYYNKLELTRFSSSVGKYVGFTEYGVRNAANWNKDASELIAMRAQKEVYCLNSIQIKYNNVLTKSAEPYVRLHSETPPGGGPLSMLVCSVYDFYPKKIIVRWTRDGRPETTGVTSTDELADGDWYYQTHSHLEYTPRSGEKISCVVEHISLSKPLVTDWNPSMPESERNKVAIGASGLILGLTLSLAGFIYYKRKARGQNTPMSSDGSDRSRIRGDLQQVHQSLDLVHLLPLTPVWCFRPVQSGFNGPVSAFNAHLFFSLNQDGSWFPVTEPGPGLGSGPAARQMEGKAGLDQMWMGAGSVQVLLLEQLLELVQIYLC
uniref:Ig-like domain-containing protein n=2 Tax=Gasterosteus aculeatus TaxID=69293 RepID=G3N561_GASAC